MDKQQAVQFIIQELSKNRSQEEIASTLSQQLGAPPDMIKKFVSQVASNYTPPAVAGAGAPVQAPPSATPASTAAYQEPSGSPVGAQTARGPAQAERAQPSSQSPGRSQVSQLGDDPEFEAMILNALGKSRRQNDVVMMVCEQTNLNWDQAQRLVARVATKHRKKLSAKQNRLAIPLSIGAILIGVAFVAAAIYEGYGGVNEAKDLAAGVLTETDNLDFLREAFWALVIGGALFLGGIAGLIMALQQQFD